MSPATRCQPRLPRSDGTNWNAPSRQYTVAPTMWAITGIGEAKKRALSAVTVPPVRSLRRKAPPSTGMRLSRRRPDGREPSAAAAPVPARCAGRCDRWLIAVIVS